MDMVGGLLDGCIRVWLVGWMDRWVGQRMVGQMDELCVCVCFLN